MTSTRISAPACPSMTSLARMDDSPIGRYNNLLAYGMVAYVEVGNLVYFSCYLYHKIEYQESGAGNCANCVNCVNISHL